MNALVVGGLGDIGGAIATTFEREGFKVRSVGRKDFDLANSTEIDRYFDHDQTAYQVLCYAAGVNRPQTFEALGLDEIRLHTEINVFGFLHVMKRLAPSWRAGQGARVLAISSLYGSIARAGRLPYVASKHALMGAVRTLAIEYGPAGVLVNALSPGYVATKMTCANNDDETIARFEAGIPLGRLAHPSEIAEVAAFLCSRRNTYLTGQNIVVDGGFSVGGFQR